MSIDEAIDMCYPAKKGDTIKKIVNYYRKRDIIIWNGLCFIPNDIISIIINKLG